jgi:imipenem/basic amino acid-specific outer membrane pore
VLYLFITPYYFATNKFNIKKGNKMNLLKLSLITIGLIATTTASYGASELQDALSGGKITQEARIVFLSGNDLGPDARHMQNADNDSNAGGFVYEMNYLTKAFHGFQIGTGFQYATDLDLHGDDATDTSGNTSHDDQRVSVETVNMHRAYLKYNFQKSNVVVGRQQIISPLLSNDFRIWGVRDSFDGAALTLNNVIPDTVAKVMYVNAWSKKNSGDTSWIDDAVAGDVRFDGVYSLYLKNKSIKDVTFDGQYLMVDNDGNYNGDVPSGTTGSYNQYYVRAKYKLPISYPVTVEAGYGAIDYNEVASAGVHGQAKCDNKSSSIMGAKIASKIGIAKVSVAYTGIDEKRNWAGTLGEGVEDVFYTGTPGTKTLYAGMKGYAVEAKAMVKPISTVFVGKIVYYNQSETGMTNSGAWLDGATAYQGVVRHNFGGALKGASATFIGCIVTYTDDKFNTTYGTTSEVLKINLAYKF